MTTEPTRAAATPNLPLSPAAGWLATARPRLYLRALLAAVALALVLQTLGGRGAAGLSGRLGGDYPAFYGAGRIIRNGDVGKLYDWRTQREAQRGLFPEDRSAFLVFPYPPFVAAAYAPLAALPYRVSYALHTLLMAAAVAGAVLLLRGPLPGLGRDPVTLFALAILFYPLLRSVGGGQNTALTILLIAAVWRLLWGERELAAGLCLGILCFKPQYAAIFLALFAAARRWRLLAGAAVSIGVLYLAGVAVAGWHWPAWWWTAGVAPWQRPDQLQNVAKSISYLESAKAILGNGSLAAKLAAAAACGLTAAALAWAYLRGTNRSLPERIGAAVAAALLISPHTMFYDVGLLVLPLAVLADRGAVLAAATAGAVWLLSWAQVGAAWLPLSPLFPLSLAVLLTALAQVRAAEGAAAQGQLIAAGTVR